MNNVRVPSKYTILLAILLCAGLWRAGLLAADVFPFHSDEAVVGLMARHILAGDRPIFFYGQAYMGSLDAFLVAGAFALVGVEVWPIRLVQVILALLLIWTSFLLAREGWGSEMAGLISAGLLAVPVVNQLLYGTVSLGGYGEALLIGNLILLGALRIAANIRQKQTRGALLWVLVTFFWIGVGLWVFALSLVYALPGAIFIAWKFIQSRDIRWQEKLSALASAGAGGLLGSLPWWLFAGQAGFQALLGELTGSAVAVEGGGWAARTGSHLVNFLLLGIPAMLGLRPPWDVIWLALPMIPVVLVIWGWILIKSVKIVKQKPIRPLVVLLSGVILTQVAAFLLTSFGVDPSGRYFLPVGVALVLFAGFVFAESHPGWQRWAAITVLLIFQAAGTLHTAWVNPPGITTQFGPQTRVNPESLPELIGFLESQGEHFGYTNYWVAYPLAFESNERLIYIPALPYHLDFRYTARDDRYPPYTEMVTEAERVAYIVTGHPSLEQALREGFEQTGTGWQERQIGDYRVFFGLTQKVTPTELEIID